MQNSPHAERSQHQDNLDPPMSNNQQRASKASPEGTGSRKEGKDPIYKSMNNPHAGQKRKNLGEHAPTKPI